MNSSLKDNRDCVYDWLRIIATIFVVIGHSTYLKIDTGLGGVDYQLPWNISVWYDSFPMSTIRFLSGWVYQFHMPLFFMLSGAVYCLKPVSSLDSICISKFKRLIIPFFLSGCFFMIPVKYFGNFYEKRELGEVYKNFLSGTESGHLWFLIALFWCIIVFSILYKVFERFKFETKYGLLLCCGFIQILAGFMPIDFFSFRKGIEYIFYFALGYVFQKEKYKFSKMNLSEAFLVYIPIQIIEFLHMRFGILNSFFEIIIGALLTYTLANICSICFARISTTYFWKVLNRNLFNIYLLHDPLEYIVLRFFFDKQLLTRGIGCLFYIFCRTIGIFLICILIGEIYIYLKNNFSKLYSRNMRGIEL